MLPLLHRAAIIIKVDCFLVSYVRTPLNVSKLVGNDVATEID